jgi:putative tryptophan/tyrosine transport system substrate-binding protein
MRRRDFVAFLGSTAAAWPLVARAQSTNRPLIGLLSPLSPATAARNIEAFQKGLRDLGYAEGRNISIQFRYAEGVPARLDSLAAELVGLKPQAILTGSPASAVAARSATTTIPLIMTSTVADPIALDLTTSLGRPSGNVTGFSAASEDALVGKRIELLRELMPPVSRIGVMANPDDPTDNIVAKSVPAAARALGIDARVFAVRAPVELQGAFAAAAREGMECLSVSQSPVFLAHTAEVADLSNRTLLPSVFSMREFVDTGGLMSYGASLTDVYRRCATLVDKILKGAKPADLPFERLAKFELVVNLKTAKTLGISVPQSILLRADEVIE